MLPGMQMEQTLSENLLSVARCFGAARSLELSTLGRMAADDGRFFARLQDPQTTFTARKYDAVMGWFAANWPDGLEWPAGVPRPTHGVPA